MCYTEHTSLAPSLHTCVYPYPPAYWSRLEGAPVVDSAAFACFFFLRDLVNWAFVCFRDLGFGVLEATREALREATSASNWLLS
jgi:hypothetical protein